MSKSNSFTAKFLVVILCVVAIIIYFFPLPYIIMAPGIAQELSPMITVENGYKNQSHGVFLLTAVSTQRSTIFDYLNISLRKPRGVELEPLSEHLPQGMDMQEYIDIMEKFMEDSKNKARAVALEKAGYSYEINYNGVIVSEVLENGSAKGKLKENDIIIAVDDKEVKDDQDAIDLIRAHEIGENVKITVKREGEIHNYKMKTVNLNNGNDNPSIGVMIYTDQTFKFPLEVEFKTDNIAGSSAGGMFALEIYNQLIKEDITKGKKIAGTGTIDLEGNIGMIDGIEQKVLAAERNGSEIFFVPEENYDNARKVARDIELVSLKTIDDALNYLEKIN